MDQNPVPPRRSFIGPVILICVGVFFLVANLVPTFDPWGILLRYWPVILILIGLGKVWDFYAVRRYPGGYVRSGASGIVIAVVLLMLLLGVGVWRRDGRRAVQRNEKRDTQAVELQGATAVTAKLQFPAGQLNVDGGSGRLLDANFRYDEGANSPQVNYSVNAGHGDLDVNEKGDQAFFGTDDNQWDLRFNDDVPLDLTLEMGAGQSNLHMQDLNLTHLQVHVGAGQMVLDLTGPRKQDLSADIQGGVGQARIRLPKDVGVRAHATGGIGAVNTHGFTKNGSKYVNAAYGKSPRTIELNVQGGVGEIDLDQE
jgi:type II secretory pathway pseudopilin PulG